MTDSDSISIPSISDVGASSMFADSLRDMFPILALVVRFGDGVDFFWDMPKSAVRISGDEDLE